MSAFFLFPSSLGQGLPLVSSGALTMQTYIPLTEWLSIGMEEGPCSCVLTGSSSVGLGARISSLIQLLIETDSHFLSRSYTVVKGVGKGPEGLFRLNPLYHKRQNEGLTKLRDLLISGRAEIKNLHLFESNFFSLKYFQILSKMSSFHCYICPQIVVIISYFSRKL